MRKVNKVNNHYISFLGVASVRTWNASFHSGGSRDWKVLMMNEHDGCRLLHKKQNSKNLNRQSAWCLPVCYGLKKTLVRNNKDLHEITIMYSHKQTEAVCIIFI